MGPGAGARPGRTSRAARTHARTHTHTHRNECTSSGANGWGMGGWGSRRTLGGDRLSSQRRRRRGGRGVSRSRTPGVVGRGIWIGMDGDGNGNVESSVASSWARLFWPRGQTRAAGRGWVAARRAGGERREQRPGRVCVCCACVCVCVCGRNWSDAL